MNILDKITSALADNKYVPVSIGTGAIILVVAVGDDPDFPLIASDGEAWGYEDWACIIDLKTGNPV